MTINELDGGYTQLGALLKDEDIAPALRTLILSLQSRNVTFEKWNELVRYVGILMLDLKNTYEFIGSLNEYLKDVDESINGIKGIRVRLSAAEEALSTLITDVFDLTNRIDNVYDKTYIDNELKNISDELNKSIVTDRIADGAIVNGKIADKAISRAKFDDTLQEHLNKSLAMPEYNSDTGIIKFTAFDGTESLIDLPVEKILKKVELKNETLVFTFADNTIIEVSVDRLIPVWTTDIANATESELLVPPTTGAVKSIVTSNYNTLDARINTVYNELADGKLSNTPFTSADAGKFVVVNSDGSLQAIKIATGGSY